MPSMSIRFDVNDNSLRKDFFDKILPDAIAALNKAAQPEWGNLTAQQMVEHLLLVLQISNGKVEFACVTPPEKLDRARAFLYSDHPTPRGFQAPFVGKEAPALKFDKFTEAKTTLMAEADIFLKAYKDNSPRKIINPMFGLIGVEDWHRHHYKHFYHHLLQFNLIEEVA